MVHLYLFLFLLVCKSLMSEPVCPCVVGEMGCHKLKPSTPEEKVIFAFTDGSGSQSYKTWDWDSITAVLVTDTHNFTSPSDLQKLMCYAHSHGSGFGFSYAVVWDDFKDASQTWVEKTATRAHDLFADFVVVDLNIIFRYWSLHADVSMAEITSPLTSLKRKLQTYQVYQHDIRFICITPWKPPCNGSDCSGLQDELSRPCDFFLLNPDSYIPTDSMACMARATMPVPQMIIGLEEYVAQGINENRLILGIPWHGYEYECQKLKDDRCYLSLTNTTDDITAVLCAIRRRKITIATMINSYKSQWLSHNINMATKAVYFNYNLTNITYQVWFEDIESLTKKYHLAHDLNLKGVALFTADDLNDYADVTALGFEKSMWAWTVQDFLYKAPSLPKEKPITPGTVAGTAAGCLLAGVVIGVFFTCLGVRKTVRKPQPPFIKDAEEFHDDDINL